MRSIDWVVSTTNGWRCLACGAQIHKPVFPCRVEVVLQEIAMALEDHKSCGPTAA